MFAAVCHYCGLEYWSHNRRRLYCSERCRRDFQNERRRDERAEAREVRDASRWDYDPWEKNDLEDIEVWGNTLLDPAPLITDNPWGGPSVELPRETRKTRKKHKHAGQCTLPGMEAWRS